MVVGYKPASTFASSFADNLCRWDGSSAPHYEVWFLTLNHRASQRGFWFRYAIESPVPGGHRSPRVALWAAAFNRREVERNLGIKQDFAIGELEFDRRESLRVGSGFLSSSAAIGKVINGSHVIEWNLTYALCETTYHHIPHALLSLTRPSSFVCSPNLDTRFSGTITVNGEEVVLQEEPGCQSHLWGRKHVDDWVWVHSNAFEKHAGTVFEGLVARPRRAGRTLPPIQSLYLRHRGEEHRFVRLRLAEQWHGKLGMGYWSFSAMNTRLYIEGTAQCRFRDMLQAEYTDPDGERLYCINSEVANLKIRLFHRTRGLKWHHIETIKAYATTHLEHASRTQDASVKLGFE